MSLSLYRKWRPRQWDEVIGQQHVIQTLRNAVASGHVAHAFLFAGPRGTGKTTTARLLAKAVNCLAEDLATRPCNQCDHCQAVNDGRFLDLIEIDAASNTSVEDVRDLRDKINFSPNQGTYKVYIIDEVHMLSTAAFNALLKTLEEPPPHAIFILATTEINKVPATVLSRCQRHEFRRLPVSDIVGELQTIIQKESLQVEPEAVNLIARQATGSLRDAISLLDQLASTGKPVTLEETLTVLGTATNQRVIDLVAAIQERDSTSGLDQIHAALDAGTDPRQFSRQVVDYLRNLLLINLRSSTPIDATTEQREQMNQQAASFTVPDLITAIRAFSEALEADKAGWQPGLPLELAFSQIITTGTASTAPTNEVNTSPLAIPRRADHPATAAGTVSTRRLPASEPARPTVEERKPESQSLHEKPLSSAGAASIESSTGIQSQVEKPAAPARPAGDENKPAHQATTPSPTGTQASKPSVASAEVAQPAAETPKASQAMGKTITLQMISQNWRQILTVLHGQKHLKTEAFLRSTRPMGVKDGCLILTVSTEFVKEKLEAGDHLEITRQAIGQVMGVDLPVRCFLANGKSTAEGLPPDLDIDSEGMVGTALRDLGGEVVDIQE